MDATDDIPGQLIHCADDGLAPWAIVCRHLLDGHSRDWIPVPVADDRPVANDWLCPACYLSHYLGHNRTKHPAAVAADLATVGVHCVGEMLAERAGTVAAHVTYRAHRRRGPGWRGNSTGVTRSLSREALVPLRKVRRDTEPEADTDEETRP